MSVPVLSRVSVREGWTVRLNKHDGSNYVAHGINEKGHDRMWFATRQQARAWLMWARQERLAIFGGRVVRARVTFSAGQ
jgi:hypothetical protein